MTEELVEAKLAEGVLMGIGCNTECSVGGILWENMFKMDWDNVLIEFGETTTETRCMEASTKCVKLGYLVRIYGPRNDISCKGVKWVEI